MKLEKSNFQKRILVYNLLLFVFPFFIVAVLIVSFAITEANTRVNRAYISLLEQVNSNFSTVFKEISYFSNIFYWNSEINSILSEKGKDNIYQAARETRVIDNIFMLNTYAFDNYQYGITLLGTNGKHFTSLSNKDLDAISKDFTEENWYQNASELRGCLAYIPSYLSGSLYEYDSEAVVFAVRQMKNQISGREIGALVVSIKTKYWDDIYNKSFNTGNQDILIMDDMGNIIYASDNQMYGKSLESSKYFNKLTNYSEGYFLANINNDKCQIVFVTNRDTNWKVIMYTPTKLLNNNWNILIIFIICSTILYLFFAIIVSYYNSKLISRPVKILRNAMLKLQDGDLTVRVEKIHDDELGELFDQFNQTTQKISNLMSKLGEDEKKKRELEIQALQAQINPHFLYNTLASVRFMIEMEMLSDADNALLSLVKLLKNTFSSQQQLITINEELETVEHYLSLLKLRHNDSFSWKINIDNRIRPFKTLKFVLQPLVENSISHGFNEKKEHGYIEITGQIKDEHILLLVKDNGIGADIDYVNKLLAGEEKQVYIGKFSGIGLKNVNDRIKLFFGEEYGINISLGNDNGTVVELKIPIVNEANLYENCNSRG